jgi:hypothetical protein
MALLMPHQVEALKKLRNGCILKGATGTGKTITALAYYMDNDPVERLIVITTAMKRDTGDWQAEARMFGLFPEVDSWNNLPAYEDVEGAFFIFDEQRVIGSGIWVQAFLRITKKNQWILLSATPGDTWMDYIPVFMANGFYATRSDFIRQHVVFAPYVKFPRVERYTGEAKLQHLLQSIQVEMFFEKKTKRHEIDIFTEYDREKYNLALRKRWNYLEDRPIRQVNEMFHLIRRAVNSHPMRLERIRDLLITHPRIIIFYNFDYELEILRTLGEEETWDREISNPQSESTRTGGNSGSITGTAVVRGSTSTTPQTLGSFAVAERNGHRHQEIPDTDSWVYLVQYASGSEGWNCTETDTVIFYSLTYSYRMFEQAKGRIDRLDTDFTDLYYYVLNSTSGIDNGIRETLSKKKNFNERKWLKKAV